MREMYLSHEWWSETDGQLSPAWQGSLLSLTGWLHLQHFTFQGHFVGSVVPTALPPHTQSLPLKAKVSKFSVLVLPDWASRLSDVLETLSQILKQKKKGVEDCREGSVVRSVCCLTEDQGMGTGLPVPTQWLKTQFQGTQVSSLASAWLFLYSCTYTTYMTKNDKISIFKK